MVNLYTQAWGADGKWHQRWAGKVVCGAAVVEVEGSGPPCGECLRLLEVLAAQYTREAAWAKWRKGDLSYKLDETQVKIYSAANAAWERVGAAPAGELSLSALKALPEVVAAALCSRRLGKSSVACVKAAETCLRKPNAVVLYLAKDGVDVGLIVDGIFKAVIAADAPKELVPEIKLHSGMVVFKNGSRIEFHGANDGKIEDLRGRAADGVVADEIGSWQDPKYALDSILKQTVMTTRGWIFIPTTPPKSPGHNSKDVIDELDRRGLVSRYTLLDSRRIEPIWKVKYLVEAGESEERALEIVRSGGVVRPQGTTARREYFVEFCADEDSTVHPGWMEAERECVVRVRR